MIDRTWLFQRSAAPLPGIVLDHGEVDDDRGVVPVTLLSAPAGAGKTTVMSSWAKNRARHGHPVAWLSLDDHDNDRVLFWTDVLAAVRVAIGDARGLATPSGADDLSAEEVSRGLPLVHLEALVASSESAVWLFLDDVQVLDSPDVLADVTQLLRGLPDALHVVLATRRDPPVALHRLRLAGRLREIRAPDLALDRSEVRQLLVHHGVTLDDSRLSLLVDRTEGWAAGVRLAALTLAGSTDPQSLVLDFAGDDRAVADYLAAEIVARLDHEEQRLLRACAVPEQLTAELAVAVTGDPEAADLLERLWRDNVLTVRLTEPVGWYRMHSLLRSYLVAELRQTDPALLGRVHARTAEWFAERGNLVWSIGHAVAAGDDDLAARMLIAHGPTLLADGRARVLRRLISSCTSTVRSEREVRELAALTALELGAPLLTPGSAIPLPRTPPTPDDRPGDDPQAVVRTSTPLSALVSLQQARRRDLGTSDTALAVSAPVADGRDDDLGLLLRLNRGLVSLMAGDLAEADSELAAATEHASLAGNDHALLQAEAGRTVLAASRGRYRDAWHLADDTIRIAARLQAVPGLEIGAVILQAAHSAHQRLDPVAARNLAGYAASALRGISDVPVSLSLTSLVAVLDVEQGDHPAEATRRLREGWLRARTKQMPPLLTIYVAYVQHRCSWQVGRPDWAKEAIDELQQRVGPGGDVEVLIATEHLTRGRGEAARRRLVPVLDGDLPCAFPTSLQQAWLAEALLSAQAGQRARSHDALGTALRMADDLGSMRAFLDMPGVPALLDDDVSRFGRLDPLVDRIRAAAQVWSQNSYAALTPKELSLLTDLPAQLTLVDIAARHQVSVNTVKTHVRSIYLKLGARNRREAIAHARRRGLL